MTDNELINVLEQIKRELSYIGIMLMVSFWALMLIAAALVFKE